MITLDGYTKNAAIRPEGIVITFGKEMMQKNGSIRKFLRSFLECMKDESLCYWLHKCTNLPKIEVDVIYIVVLNRLWAKVYCGGYRTRKQDSSTSYYDVNGVEKPADWNHIILSGPMVRCPFKRELKGFQGFRYCTRLF